MPLHPLQFTYIATISFIIHLLSSRSAPLGGILFSLQYSCTFSHIGCASLLSCCAFCGLATYIAFFFLLFFFLTSIFGHSYLKWLTLQHLKHFTFSIISYLLTFTSSLTSHYITLLAITSNLFWEINLLFSSPFLFLQLWARCPNLLYLQHTLPSLPSIFALSLARAYCWLSISLIRELYYSRDIMLYLQRSQIRNDLTTVTSTGVQDFHPARHLLPYLLLP